MVVGAIGGVINVLDDRIPTSVPKKGYAGQIHLPVHTVANENIGVVGLTLGKENFALRLEELKRHAQDYRMPKRAGELDSYCLQGSYNRTDNFNIGASWIGEKSYIGMAYGIQHSNMVCRVIAILTVMNIALREIGIARKMIIRITMYIDTHMPIVSTTTIAMVFLLLI
ncbi:MAG: hypothetical protein AB8W37_12225 [Arsenophonus endosymbiont of Dermacentor nuttalli]